MPNLPDLTRSLITRKKKVSPFCHFRGKNRFGRQRWRQLCTCTTNTTGVFLAFRRVSVKKSLFYSSRNAWFGFFFRILNARFTFLNFSALLALLSQFGLRFFFFFGCACVLTKTKAEKKKRGRLAQ